MTTNKQQALKRLSNEKGIIGALAIDQRGSLKKMLGKGSAVSDTAIEQFKVCVSEELTPMRVLSYSIQNMVCQQLKHEQVMQVY